MIYFIVARKDQTTFETYLKESVDNIDSTLFQITGEESLCQKYNIGIKSCIDNDLKADDIVIFVHEDVKLLDHFFQEKVEKVFSEKQDVGILGIAGTTKFVELGGWWMTNSDNLRGDLIQEVDKAENHLIKGGMGYYDDLVAIDGLIMMVRGSVLLDGLRFDDKFESSFDFYDINFCFDFLLKTNLKIAVAHILVQHRSQGLGSLSQEWKDAKKNLIDKYKALGLTFPITAEKIREFKEKK